MKSWLPIPYTTSHGEIEARADLRDIRVFTNEPRTACNLKNAVHYCQAADQRAAPISSAGRSKLYCGLISDEGNCRPLSLSLLLSPMTSRKSHLRD